MDRPMSNRDFKLMTLGFKFRDLLSPRINTLKEVGIKSGDSVLDYGCGPGNYTVVTARLVGESGKVYALDIHPLAVQKVQNIVAKRRLTNIETILSDCATGLADESIDAALLYDTLHEISEPGKTLVELHRVLKPDGILSFNDHHLKDEEVITGITANGLFKLSNKGERVYNFVKVQ